MQSINYAAAAAALAIVSPRRLYLAEDNETVVEEGDERASFLAVGQGSQTTDPRVIEHLGVAVPQGATLAAPAPSIKPVETEQSPTRNQIELEAGSRTAASVAEVVAIEQKEKAGTATGPVEEAKADMPLENRATPPVDEAMNGSKAERPAEDKAVKPAADKAVSPTANKSVAAPQTKAVETEQAPTSNQTAIEIGADDAGSETEASAQLGATAGQESEVNNSKTTKTEISGLPASVVLDLTGAGLDSAEKVRAASDEEILAIDGIGEKALEKIRAAYPKEG